MSEFGSSPTSTEINPPSDREHELYLQLNQMTHTEMRGVVHPDIAALRAEFVDVVRKAGRDSRMRKEDWLMLGIVADITDQELEEWAKEPGSFGKTAQFYLDRRRKNR
jgi:hypothetical protein